MKIKIKDVDYEIPLSWSDLTYNQAVAAISEKIELVDKINILTSIPIAEIEKTSIRDVDTLLNYLSFINDQEIFDSKEPSDLTANFDFGSLTYGVSEKVKKLFSNEDKTVYEVMPDVFEVMFNVDIRQKTFTDVIGDINNFFFRSMFFMRPTKNFTKKAKIV